MLNACANANNNCWPFKEIPCEISLFGSGAGGGVVMCRVVVTLKRLIPCIKCCTHPEAHDMTVFQILYLWQCRTISMTFIYLLIFLLTSFVPIRCSFWIFNVFCFFSPWEAGLTSLFCAILYPHSWLSCGTSIIIVCSTLSLLLLLPLAHTPIFRFRELSAVDVLKLLVFIVIVCFIHLRLKSHTHQYNISASNAQLNRTESAYRMTKSETILFPWNE